MHATEHGDGGGGCDAAWGGAFRRELASLGVRNVGSAANEVAAPAYLLEQLHGLQGAATAAGATLQVERQQASGHFTIDFLTDFTSVYVARSFAPSSAPLFGVSYRTIIGIPSRYCPRSHTHTSLQLSR